MICIDRKFIGHLLLILLPFFCLVTLSSKTRTMAEIISTNNHSGKRRRLPATRIDMTPMVDLAFLLLTFFILAATLAKPNVVELIYPDPTGNPSPVNKKMALTVLLGDKPNELFYYFGLFDPATTEPRRTDFSASGLRKVFLERNNVLIKAIALLKAHLAQQEIDEAFYREEYKRLVGAHDIPFVIVKTLPKTKYEDVVAVMDELNIADMRKRSIQDMTANEKSVLEMAHTFHN